MSTSKLAIVIPAYKARFLDDCLHSICSQTNKNFTVYIGNDGSPDDIDIIVVKYKDTIHIEYKKFDNNLGGTSLIKQWERCIAMINDEEWIWLFSDDDMMDQDCVESFYNLQNENDDCNVFRFNLQVVNTNGKVVRTTIYPKDESADSFLINRFALKYDSAISNYIFSRTAYNKFGFKEFPLAWCSDDASIINFSGEQPIIAIDKSYVQWRVSALNISAMGSDAIQKQKVHARLAYIKWLYASGKLPFLRLAANKKIILHWMVCSIKGEFQGFSAREKKKLLRDTEKIIGINIWYFQAKKSLIYFKNDITAKLKLVHSKKWTGNG